MKKVLIVANWKSNKTIKQTEEWFMAVKNGLSDKKFGFDNKEIIIAPSFISLEHSKYCIKKLLLPFKLAAQNISNFDEGPYTGEVNGKQLNELADFVLIGHSERRKNFGETDQICSKKVDLALKYGLKPIYFIQSKESPVPGGVEVVAYEPVFSVGTGIPDTPENANRVANSVKLKNNNKLTVIYGGSVMPENVNGFTSKEDLDGIIVGGASLDPLKFIRIVENA